MHTCMLSCFSHFQLFVTLWTVACQGPLSMGFSRQEYWSGLPCPSPGDLPNPGIEPASLMSPALAGELLSLVPRGKPGTCHTWPLLCWGTFILHLIWWDFFNLFNWKIVQLCQMLFCIYWVDHVTFILYSFNVAYDIYRFACQTILAS